MTALVWGLMSCKNQIKCLEYFLIKAYYPHVEPVSIISMLTDTSFIRTHGSATHSENIYTCKQQTGNRNSRLTLGALNINDYMFSAFDIIL